MPGINSQTDLLKDYAEQAAKSGAKHVSFFNYRTSGARIAQREFESRGYNYTRMLEKNLDENWQPIGKKLKQFLREQGIPSSSPDFVNFPFDNDCESCCGVDGLFVPYRFTFQYACKCIESKGSVSWSDMEEIEFREPNAYETMKANWNGGDVYSLADSPEVVVLDKDSDGMNIYGKREDNPDNKQGFFF